MATIIPTKDNVKTVTDLRENTMQLLNFVAKKREPLYIFYRSKPKAVLLSIDEFIKQVELWQDARDLEKAIETNGGEFVDFQTLDQELRKEHGLPSYRRKKG